MHFLSKGVIATPLHPPYRQAAILCYHPFLVWHHRLHLNDQEVDVIRQADPHQLLLVRPHILHFLYTHSLTTFSHSFISTRPH